MNLSKDEWLRMWDSIKRIEYLMGKMKSRETKIEMFSEITRIKRQIESVIGKME